MLRVPKLGPNIYSSPYRFCTLVFSFSLFNMGLMVLDLFHLEIDWQFRFFKKIYYLFKGNEMNCWLFLLSVWRHKIISVIYVDVSFIWDSSNGWVPWRPVDWYFIIANEYKSNSFERTRSCKGRKISKFAVNKELHSWEIIRCEFVHKTWCLGYKKKLSYFCF